MTFCPPALLFLQDLCKKAQWRAKKLRERGSNTARPTEKGVGGLPIRSRRADSVASCRDFGVPVGPIRSRPVAISACRSCRLCRFGRVLSRFGVPVLSIWTAACVAISACRSYRHRRQDTKKPDSSIGESGSAIARRRAFLCFD